MALRRQANTCCGLTPCIRATADTFAPAIIASSTIRAFASNLASGMGGIWLYAGTETGLTRVPDCFCRWQDVVAGDAMDALVSGTAPAPVVPLPAGEAIHALVSVPDAPERLFAALESGIWASS